MRELSRPEKRPIDSRGGIAPVSGAPVPVDLVGPGLGPTVVQDPYLLSHEVEDGNAYLTGIGGGEGDGNVGIERRGRVIPGLS